MQAFKTIELFRKSLFPFPRPSESLESNLQPISSDETKQVEWNFVLLELINLLVQYPDGLTTSIILNELQLSVRSIDSFVSDDGCHIIFD